MVNLKKIKIKKVLLFGFLIISIFLLFLNTKFILNVDVHTDSEAYISCSTLPNDDFEKYYIKLENNKHEYSIYLNTKIIKQVKLEIASEHIDFSVKINKAGIKLPYLPVIYYSLKENTVLSNEYQSIIFKDISNVVIIAPIILLLISILSFILLFYKSIKSFFKNIKNYNILFIGIIIFIILFELVKFTGMYSNTFGSNITLFIFIFKSDSYFLSVFIILLYIAIKVESKIVSALIMLIIFAMVFTLVLDIALIQLLSARLRFGEAGGFIPDIPSIIKMAKGFFLTSVGIYALVLFIYVILFAVFIIRRKEFYKFSKPYKIAITVMAIIFAPLFMFTMDIHTYNGTAFQESIIAANLKKTENVEYSRKKIKNILNNFKFENKCIDGINSRKNIIVLIMESVSSYKSKLFGGIENKMEILDNIAKNNIYASEYYSNSYNSIKSKFNILTGSPLITKVNNQKYIKTMLEKSIVHDFINNGYNIEYYSSTDTIFDDTRQMVTLSGISNIYDANSDIFSHIKKRYIFNGVEDKLFYETVVNNLLNKKHNKPYLAFLTTMSTHSPYQHPVTKEYSFDKVLEYSNIELNNFIKELEKKDFFKNGILVITADHRVMLPLTLKEYEKLGPLANSRIPLIIINENEKYEIKGNFSHMDLGKSLEYLTLNKVCFNQFQKNIFGNENNNKCTIYQQLVNLALVDIKCGNNYGRILLDGDNTRFINDKNLNLNNNEKNKIIEYINYLRIIE